MGSNHRPSGYEPDELPLLYSAPSISFRPEGYFGNRLQRYGFFLICTNFRGKKPNFFVIYAFCCGKAVAMRAPSDCTSRTHLPPNQSG